MSPRERSGQERKTGAEHPAARRPAAPAESPAREAHPAALLRAAAEGSRALAPRDVLRLQRALGNRAVGRLLSRGGAAGVLQRISASITISKTDGTISSASVGGSRPASNVRGTQGDHTTPYATFEQMARNNVIGQTPANAVNNLRVVMQRIKALPGYQNAGGATLRSLNAYADPWINWAQGANAPTKQEVQQMMVAVVTLRNSVPLTAYRNNPSTGGHNEAASTGGLDWAEFKVRSGTWTTQADFTGDPMQNVWDTFDFAAPSALTAQGWADVLNQHMLSIRESYPYIFEIRAIYSLQDMRNHLVNQVLTGKLGAVFAGQVAALL